MIKLVWIGIFFLVPQVVSPQMLLKSNRVETRIFSQAPVENIEAVSQKGASAIDMRTGEILVRIPIAGLQFEKALMQEHFNDKFMETRRYPYASFQGRFEKLPDISNPGEYEAVLQGELEVHGRSRTRRIPVLLHVTPPRITLHAEFDVACEDHDIQIPRILWQNIAEVIAVQVKIPYPIP